MDLTLARSERRRPQAATIGRWCDLEAKARADRADGNTEPKGGGGPLETARLSGAAGEGWEGEGERGGQGGNGDGGAGGLCASVAFSGS